MSIALERPVSHLAWLRALARPLMLAILFWLLVFVLAAVGVYLVVRVLRSPASPDASPAGELRDPRCVAGRSIP